MEPTLAPLSVTIIPKTELKIPAAAARPGVFTENFGQARLFGTVVRSLALPIPGSRRAAGAPREGGSVTIFPGR